MSEVASPSQLRWAFVRVALFVVPGVLLLGAMSGWLGGSSGESGWYLALDKPGFLPPASVFPIAWTVLYILMGIAAAMVAVARGAPWRSLALAVFTLQFCLNLAWSPLFFGMHQVSAALVLLLILLALALLTTALFFRVRPLAGWAMVPYCLWLCFALLLNYEIDARNPDAETLQAAQPGQRIELPPAA